MSEYPGWHSILQPGEKILWQGAPVARIDLREVIASGNWQQAMMGIFFACFGLFWTSGAYRATGDMFALIGLIFTIQGMVMAGKVLVWPSFLLSRSYYTLTDRHAFIATDDPLRGRKIASWPLEPGMVLEWVDTRPPTIIFGTQGVEGRVEFRYIDEAETVMRLARGVEAGQRARNAHSPRGGEWLGEEWGWREHSGNSETKGDSADIAASNIPQVDAARRGDAPAIRPADADRQPKGEQPPPLPPPLPGSSNDKRRS